MATIIFFGGTPPKVAFGGTPPKSLFGGGGKVLCETYSTQLPLNDIRGKHVGLDIRIRMIQYLCLLGSECATPRHAWGTSMLPEASHVYGS